MRIDTGDTTWLLISTALVMLMTPGLALFYGGMVRKKNVLGTIMQSFIALGIVTIQWVLFGYSLAFGPDVHHFIGNLSWLGLNGVGLEPNPDYAATVPHQAFMLFQMMFAVITPALITGAFAERFKFSAYIIFLFLWSTIVYDPIAHWVWGVGGWIHNLGALDFAGGLVVHISSGVSALAAAFVVGKRRGHGHDLMPPHNLTMTLLGAAMLWFGWFGFNGGSALASGALGDIGISCHAYCRCGCDVLMGIGRMEDAGKTDYARCSLRMRCWFGRYYAGRRFCRSACSTCDRSCSRSGLLLRNRHKKYFRISTIHSMQSVCME